MTTKPLARRTVPAKAQQELARLGLDWQPGDILMKVYGSYDVGYIYRVVKINTKGIELIEDDDEELVKLLAHELKCKEDVVWQGIQWWKLKNRWKRPVSQDDAKAYRMVKGWIRRNKS